MKFSYAELKKLVPEIPGIADVAERLTMRLFEVESAEGGVLDVKLLPNRYSDAACYLGLAREIAAMWELPFTMPKTASAKAGAKLSVPAAIEMARLCRRIMTCPVFGVKIGASPAWLKDALAAHGMRPINAVVDITNWITLETGQPLHAFDLDKVAEGGLAVRQAKEGETIETLDGKEYRLTPSALVIADRERALDIAGIKGGKHAEVSPETGNIVIVAANFDGALIYKTSRRIGLATDASVRFSHHLHPALVERGMKRALALVAELCGGTPGKTADEWPKPEKNGAIRFDAKRFNAITGFSASETACFAALKRLGFAVRGKNATPPEERTDILIFEDCAEEVARMIGYENLPETAPTVMIAPSEPNRAMECADAARQTLAGCGLTEIKAHSFGTEGEIALENPLNADQGWLRSSLVPGLAAAAERNMRREDTVRLFEIGRTFRKKATHEPEEETKIGIAVASRGTAEDAIREVRGLAERLLEALGVRNRSFVEKRKGELAIEIGGAAAGSIFFAKKEYALVTAELNLAAITEAGKGSRRFIPIPRFPEVVRDITLAVDAGLRIGTATDALRRAAEGLAAEAEYQGSYAKDGKKSITFRLTFRAEDRTLAGGEADAAQSDILARLAKDFPFEIK